MNRTFTFGAVGGYGSTGKIVTSELLNSSDGTLLIGARNPDKAKALAAELGSRVTPAHLDVFEANPLDRFCSQCSIILNLAGPVMALQDRVAQAAFCNGCHYVDPAGMSLVKERLLDHSKEIEASGLSFVVSAGWTPGLTELLPAYALAQARAKMDAVELLSVYFADSGDWSENALRDAAWFIRHSGLRSPGYFHKGEWTKARMSEASPVVDLGDPVGSHRFALYFLPELADFARQRNDIDMFSYSYLSGFRTVMASMLMALFPLPERMAIHLVRNIFRRNRLAVDGFITAQVRGTSAGRKSVLTAQIVYRDRRDYWIHGLTLATVARLISQGRAVRHGVHFLADAIDPVVFTDEVRKAGVEQTDEFKSAA